MKLRPPFSNVQHWLSLSLLTLPLLSYAKASDLTFETFPHQGFSVKSSYRDRCPVPCSEAGPTGFSWSVLPSVNNLRSCNETLLFESSLRQSITTPDKSTVIRACSVPGSASGKALHLGKENIYGPPCLSSAKLRTLKINAELSWDKDTVDGGRALDVVAAANQLRKNLIEDPSCSETALLARSGDAVVGVWVGRQVRKTSAAPFIDQFLEDFVNLKDAALPKKAFAQICSKSQDKKCPASQAFGIVYDATGNIGGVFESIRSWSEGSCLPALGDTGTWKDVKLNIIPASALSMGAGNAINASTNSTSHSVEGDGSGVTNSIASSSKSSVETAEATVGRAANCKSVTVQATDSCFTIATQKCGVTLADLYKLNGIDSEHCRKLQVGEQICCSSGSKPEPQRIPAMRLADKECKYVQVEADDSCWSIAQECGIPEKELHEFNGGSDKFCNPLKLRSAVCCSEGEKPNLKPKPDQDGNCAVHIVGKEATCYDIGEQYLLTTKELIEFNKGKTWGWAGCGKLQPDAKICISDGKPPMPAPIENAVCGPQAFNGKDEISSSKNISMLNPCPLNVCCNIWGQCGMSSDFCIDTAIDDTPGTAKNGTFGCISNCGMEIVNNKVGPEKFRTLAYFEGWNKNRDCLHMDVTDIPEGNDIIHFAFGWISEDFQISIGADSKDQFGKFVRMTGFKKVISFGGWAFSNEPATSHIIRNGVKPENAVKFATNIVNFVNTNNLDGVDFDWEYPGATDIEGSQPGTPNDGKNYLAFLQLVRRRLGSGKILAIAAPASYWYLRSFPIGDMSKVVDYIVYMTYDLHGQWDVGNKWASEGCEGGNCLRSHINSTLTHTSLAMITKAGVASNKIFVGVTSYGRSFKMGKINCEGPNCKFLGGRNDSPAAPGVCTDTGGYLADAEIMQIKNIADAGIDGTIYHEFYDKESDSDIFVYDNLEWVGWMSPTTKNRRKGQYEKLNMGGTTDWAIDLGGDIGISNSEEDFDYEMMDLSTDCKFDITFNSLDDLDAVAGSFQPMCAAMHAIKVLQGMLTHSLDGYDDAADGYDGLFEFYEDYIIATLESRLNKLVLGAKDDGGRGDEFFTCYAKQGGRYAERDGAEKAECSDLPTGKQYDDYAYWLDLDDEEGWEKALEEEGILPEWVKLDLKHVETDLSGCQVDGTNICLGNHYYYHDFPMPVEKSEIEVPDPKVIVDLARNNMENLTASFEDMYITIGMDSWEGGLEDAVEVLAVPIFLLEDAVDNMVEVKEIGKDYKEAQEKQLILAIVEGILFLLGFLGPILGTLGRIGGALGRLAAGLEGAGGAGLFIYSIVEDPSAAPMAILSMLLGGLVTGPGGSSTRGSRFHDLNTKRKEMTTDEKDSLGSSYSRNTPKVESIMSKSCKK